MECDCRNIKCLLFVLQSLNLKQILNSNCKPGLRFCSSERLHILTSAPSCQCPPNYAPHSLKAFHKSEQFAVLTQSQIWLWFVQKCSRQKNLIPTTHTPSIYEQNWSLVLQQPEIQWRLSQSNRKHVIILCSVMVMPYPLIHGLWNRTRLLDPHPPLAFRKNASACLVYLAAWGKQGKFVPREYFSRKRRRKVTPGHSVLKCMKCTRCCPCLAFAKKKSGQGVELRVVWKSCPCCPSVHLWGRWVGKLGMRASGCALTALPSFHLFNTSFIAGTHSKTCQGLLQPPSHANP